MKKYGAYYVQSGTNYRLSEWADTMEELEVKLWGQAYTPKRESIQYVVNKEDDLGPEIPSADPYRAAFYGEDE
jgi:hypothetical protein